MTEQDTAGGAGVGPSLEEESRRRAQRPSADTIDVYEALDAAALADLAGDVVAQGREAADMHELVDWLRPVVRVSLENGQ